MLAIIGNTNCVAFPLAIGPTNSLRESRRKEVKLKSRQLILPRTFVSSRVSSGINLLSRKGGDLLAEREGEVV